MDDNAVLPPKPAQETVQAVKRLVIKCSDICNPVRSTSICREWAIRIADEYFDQASSRIGFSFVCISELRYICHRLHLFCVLESIYYLCLNQVVPVSDLPSRRRLRSSSTLQLLVPPYRLTTIGRRSFPVAASIVWNSRSPPVFTISSRFDNG